MYVASDTVSIASDAWTAEVTPLGAELHALRDEHGRDLLWDGDPAVWKGRAPILFPVVGAVAGGEIRVGGAAFPMAKHGFARHSRFVAIDRTDSAVTFRLEDDEATRSSYPFAFRLDLHFALTGAALEMSATVFNRGAVEMPASFGFHPALRWPLPAGGDRADHRIRFDDDEDATIRRVGTDGLLRPEPEPTPVDGRELRLDDALFVDDALIFAPVRSRGLDYGKAGMAGLRVEFDGLPDLGVWTKPGAGYLCIEPWAGHADPQGYAGELREKPGIVLLAPGDSRKFRMRIAQR